MAENGFPASRLLLLLNDGTVPTTAFEAQSPQVVKRKSEDTNTASEDAQISGDPSNESGKRLRAHAASHNSIANGKLGCPFFQRNKHSEGLSKSCMGPGWDALYRVKEHIHRCHLQPKHQCNRCCQKFNSNADLVAHQRALTSCELRTAHAPATITPDQESRLRSRAKSRPGVTEAEKWQLMYRIIFPDETHIPSPFLDRPCRHCTSTANIRLLNENPDYQMQQPSLLVGTQGMHLREGNRGSVEIVQIPKLDETSCNATQETGCSATHSQPLLPSPMAMGDEWQSQATPFDEDDFFARCF
ncbi:hypothetical protein F4803DRAFT_544669 [Xylaria telfairii]|nr:hypothetical protein F4803DRAFT_544669 [Xylaria telfairii]